MLTKSARAEVHFNNFVTEEPPCIEVCIENPPAPTFEITAPTRESYFDTWKCKTH